MGRAESSAWIVADHAGELGAGDPLQLAEPAQLALGLRARLAELIGLAAAELVDLRLGAAGGRGRRARLPRAPRPPPPVPADQGVQPVLALLQLGRAAGGLFLGACGLRDELLSDVVAVSFGFAQGPFGDLGGGAARRRADLLGFGLGEPQHPLGPRAEAGVGRVTPDRTTRISSSTATACCSAIARRRSLSVSAACSAVRDSASSSTCASTAAGA